MDMHDDPSTTTTTTDYDSGDSEGVDYVYESQRSAEKRTAKARSPRRRKSPKARPRGPAKCVCGGARADDDAESTVFEEDTDTEDDQPHRSRPTKPRPTRPHGGLASEEKGHHKADRKKAAEKAHRARTPYIEEYPDELPRPAILLKEHKIPRRFSASDTKRVRDSEDRSSTSGSRGRSPGKRLPRAPHRPSKASPKHSGHRKRRIDVPEDDESNASSSDAEEVSSDSGEPAMSTPRRLHYEKSQEPASTVSRSSAWNDTHQSKYSSSWPLHDGSHLRRKQLRRDLDGDSDAESEEDYLENGNFNQHHRSRRDRAPSFRGRGQERKHSEPIERDREPRRERERSRTRLRPKTIISRPSMSEMDRAGPRSVATELCEVWRGRAEDWESPYVSGVGSDCDDIESDVDEHIQALRLEDFPPRTYSPSLAPPFGERRDFGFQAMVRSPPPPTFGYMRDPSPGPHLGLYRSRARRGPNGLLLEGPPALTVEPMAMGEEEDKGSLRPSSLASGWSRPGLTSSESRTYPGPAPPPPPASRGVSPIFSARKTREFLSPKPTRAARFDFDVWNHDRASRSSQTLDLF
ncbi:hypothetical protein MMYC01_207212 [Madurella mycetomatis]|uniref:Uncharacterized protein n=1 Tax=Madurella mycetomatis TaxID=100816 RepID=A0A175W310_9PEZI|nr:hypothetical protein MMYC01_207212 [Madurella mycetomatis]